MSEFDINKLPGLKRRDLQPCIGCGKGMMHAGSLTFYRLKIERACVNPAEVQRETGLEGFFGGGSTGAALAHIMGTNPDLAKILGSHVVLVCDECAMRPRAGCIAMMAERAAEREEEKTEAAEGSAG